MNVTEFKKLPLMGILRGVEKDDIVPLVETLTGADLFTVEVTMNTPGATELIALMQDTCRGRLTVGAGTVTNIILLKQALDAGASFIVLPTFVAEVVDYCVKHTIPVFPGALTPQEIHRVSLCGATMVKVFPAKVFGPSYFKEIKGPLGDIELLACGGITPETLPEYFKQGASAVAFGGSVLKKEWLKAHDYSRIRDAISSLVTAYRDLPSK